MKTSTYLLLLVLISNPLWAQNDPGNDRIIWGDSESPAANQAHGPQTPGDTPVSQPSPRPTLADSAFLIEISDPSYLAEKPESESRTFEIRRVLTTLSSPDPRQAHVVLTGENGSGRMSVILEVTRLIQSGRVAPALKGSKVFLLDMAELLSTDSNAIKNFTSLLGSLDTVRTQTGRPPVLVIDHLEDLIPTGQESAGKNIAYLLSKSMKEGKIRLAGLGTEDMYTNRFSQFADLEAITNRIPIESFTSEEMTEALRLKHRSRLEKTNQVKIADEAISALFKIGERYLPTHRSLEQRLWLMQEVINYALEEARSPRALEKLNADIERVSQLLEYLKSEKDQRLFNEWNLYDDTLKDLLEKKRLLSEQGQHLNSSLVTERHVAEYIADRLSTRSRTVTADELLLNNLYDPGKMAKDLKSVVFGADEAMERISEVISSRGRSPVLEDRPLGAFFLTGPTGVGKTETGRGIAEILLGDGKKAVLIELNKFMEQHRISELIGSPAGYERGEKLGHLYEIVKNNPKAVIIFDEIEKADPAVMNILLSILNEGETKSNHGEVLSFRETTIVVTTNLIRDTRPEAMLQELENLSKFNKGLEGYVEKARAELARMETIGDEVQRAHQIMQLRKNIVHTLLVAKGTPEELLGRFDELIAFLYLDKPAFIHIADKMIKKLVSKPYNKSGIKITVDPILSKIVGNRAHYISSKIENKGGRSVGEVVLSMIKIPLQNQVLPQLSSENKEIFITVAKETGEILFLRGRGLNEMLSHFRAHNPEFLKRAARGQGEFKSFEERKAFMSKVNELPPRERMAEVLRIKVAEAIGRARK